jgi:hypothetical protein
MLHYRLLAALGRDTALELQNRAGRRAVGGIAATSARLRSSARAARLAAFVTAGRPSQRGLGRLPGCMWRLTSVATAAIPATVLLLAGVSSAHGKSVDEMPGAVSASRAASVNASAPGGAPPLAPSGAAPEQALCSTPAGGDASRPYSFRYGLRPSELQSEFFDAETGLSGRGYRPTRLTGYRSGDQQLFATKWVHKSGPPWYGRFGLTGDQFHSLYLQRRNQDWPIDVSGYNTPSGAERFAVIWERNTSGVSWKVHRNATRDDMQDYVDEYSRTGWVPLRVEAYTQAGTLSYISTWIRTSCAWRMHNKMTRAEYQNRLEHYEGTYRLVHLDSFVERGNVYYAGIWWRQPGPSQVVRSNRDWYLFQRFFNNYQCQGAVIDNFTASEVPGGVRYGGIWTFGGSTNPDPSLIERIRRELVCAPGRAGAAVIDLATGEESLVHADAPYGTSSTIKSAILYALLRRVDATNASLNTQLDVGAPYGSNQGSTLTANQSYTLGALATTMIRDSNNWATNRLIDWLGREAINDEIADLGLSRIRLERYMTGPGAPSAHGNSGPGGDYAEGWDNTATPREYAASLRRVHQNTGLLTPVSFTFFWNTMALNADAHDAVLDIGVGTNWQSVATLGEKAGSNSWSSAPAHRAQLPGAHLQRSAAGRLVFANGHVVFYAAFVDEADSPTTTPLQNMLDCVVMHAVRHYGGQATSGDVPACQGA